MPPIDPSWRASLKVGDKLDVLKEERVDAERLEAWTVGTIREVVGDIINCSFDGLHESKRELFNKNGVRIAPLGMRTQGLEWKEKLAADDRVDVFDTQGKWFLGTVLDTSIDNDGLKMLYIGFRIYISNGTKVDSNGRRHEGWSAQYDTLIPTYSIRIQPYQ